MGIAVAILEELKKSGALYLVTTHYPEIKTYAEREEGVINARMTFDPENFKPLYRMVIGEAGESCALHIAKRLGMPAHMLRRAASVAYNIPETDLRLSESENETKKNYPRLQKQKQVKQRKQIPFKRGDSVMVYPEEKIGIVFKEANEKGVLRVQLPGKKIWINHKRVKLMVPAKELYPEDYDFSIIFDSVEVRKLRHDMERKYTEGEIYLEE
jgi:dsDNA-specific endonuclease/ATPase MutS2